MPDILLITSSPNGDDSFSTRFARELATSLAEKSAGRLTVRDLAAEQVPHIDAAYIQGRALAADARTSSQSAAIRFAETLVEELKAADIVVVGTGMINFGPNTQLKAWFDHVIWPGVTFKYTEGGAEGLITGKKAYLVTASGGVYSEGPLAPLDFLSAYARQLLAFIGLSDIEHIRVEGLGYGREAVEAANTSARTRIQAIVQAAA